MFLSVVRVLAAMALACMLTLGVFAQGDAGVTPPISVDTPPISIEEPVNTQVALNDPDIYNASLAALTVLLVVAVLLENAFSLLFSWRVFITYFSVRGLKTLVMLVASVVVVVYFKLDVVASLLAAYKVPVADAAATAEAAASLTSPVSQFITAMILAGGSSGVYNIMRSLGFRNDTREEEVSPKPTKDAAWLAIKVHQKQSAGSMIVKVQRLGPANAVQDAPAPIAGVIGTKRPSLGELLLKNTNRFPPNGGYTLEPDIVYEVTIEASDREGQPVIAPANVNKKLYRLAPGAMVDLEATI